MSQLFKNNAKSRLATNISDSALSFTVRANEGALFPVLTADDHMLVTLENAAGDKEIVRISARSGDTFTIHPTPGYGRAQEGTTARAFAVDDLVELRLTAGFIDALKEGSIVFVIDGGGADITTGIKGWIEAPFYGTIKSARLFADAVGDITVHVWKDIYDNYPPTDPADEMTPATGISIVSSNGKPMAQFTDLSSWLQRGFSKGDIFAFSVSACTGITKLTISLTVDRY